MTQRNQAVEEAQVVQTAMNMLGSSGQAASLSAQEESFEVSAKKPLVGEDFAERRLGYVSGVLMKADEARFARALWRASRGNTFTNFGPIDTPVRDPKTNQVMEKSVFVVYFQGDGGSMHSKIMKVCQAFGVNLYQWPSSPEQASQRYAVLTQTL